MEFFNLHTKNERKKSTKNTIIDFFQKNVLYHIKIILFFAEIFVFVFDFFGFFQGFRLFPSYFPNYLHILFLLFNLFSQFKVFQIFFSDFFVLFLEHNEFLFLNQKRTFYTELEKQRKLEKFFLFFILCFCFCFSNSFLHFNSIIILNISSFPQKL